MDRVICKPQSQRSLRESQKALLERVEELTEQLKQERQRALTLEGKLNTSTLSLQTLDKVADLHIYLFPQQESCNGFDLIEFFLFQLQERISDLEGERDLIKENYNSLLEK